MHTTPKAARLARAAALIAALSSEACGGRVEATGVDMATGAWSGTPAGEAAGAQGVPLGGSPRGNGSPGTDAGGITQAPGRVPVDGGGSGGELGGTDGGYGELSDAGAGAGGEVGQAGASVKPDCKYRQYRCEGAILLECDPQHKAMHLVQRCVSAEACIVLFGSCVMPD